MLYKKSDLLKLYSDPEFYDIEFKERNDEIDFYIEHAMGAQSVLEVACGSGRITIPIFQTGVNICGRDISPKMVEKAHFNAQAKGLPIDFRVEDAKETTGAFDLIFMATNAFQHVLSFEDALASLQSFKSALLPRGRLILDFQIPDVKRLSREAFVERPYKTFFLGDQLVEATINGCYEALHQIYAFNIKYYAAGECIKEKRVAMRMYFPQELQLLFDRAGFKIHQTFGGYDEVGLSDDSDKQIYVLVEK